MRYQSVYTTALLTPAFAPSQLRLWRLRLILLLGLVLQHPPQNLARLRLGHLLDEAHASAQLLGRPNLGVEPPDYVLGPGLRLFDAGLEHDVGARDLGVLHLVPDADDADVGDVFAAVELGLELCGGDLEALWKWTMVSLDAV